MKLVSVEEFTYPYGYRLHFEQDSQRISKTLQSGHIDTAVKRAKEAARDFALIAAHERGASWAEKTTAVLSVSFDRDEWQRILTQALT